MSIKVEYEKIKRPIKRINFEGWELRRDQDNWELSDPYSVSSGMDLDDLRDLRDACNAILGDYSEPIVSGSEEIVEES